MWFITGQYALNSKILKTNNFQSEFWKKLTFYGVKSLRLHMRIQVISVNFFDHVSKMLYIERSVTIQNVCYIITKYDMGFYDKYLTTCTPYADIKTRVLIGSNVMARILYSWYSVLSFLSICTATIWRTFLTVTVL